MTNDLNKQALETGLTLMPRFDENGLICAIAQDAATNDILMVAWMNSESLALTVQTGIAHYWSRTRGEIWKKGDTSGQLQTVHEIRIDCDQDAVVLRVAGDGGCCHVGYKSCFYRAVADETGRLLAIQERPITSHEHEAALTPPNASA
jgi:phosphoribosyl-AMP cyclohydrolase